MDMNEKENSNASSGQLSSFFWTGGGLLTVWYFGLFPSAGAHLVKGSPLFLTGAIVCFVIGAIVSAVENT